MSKLSEISVAILAGGLGTRIQQTLKGKPKVLAEVRKRPFLEYLLYQLDLANFKNIVLCTGYGSDQVEKAFGGKYKNLQLLYSSEQMPLGTAGSLRKAYPLFNSETILVMNGDSFCGVDFKKFWQFHLNKNSQVSLVLTSVPDTNRYGKVKLGSDDSITQFQEKKEGVGLINAGIYLIKMALIATIPEGKIISLEKDVFPTWIGKGFYGYKANNNFIDIGTPEDYVQVEQFFKNHKL